MENRDDEKALFTWGAFLVLLVLLLTVDILFRVLIKDNKKMWMLQLAFLFLASIACLIVKATFS
ncbi:hypothetical protein ABTW24_01060 [Sphingobacterium thalpophilum]|uniref:Uncharacterized protein n=1 Tax=Sphingobacterium thalpophilum TaxID=259 RepID=A0ABV4H827_9SPHI